MLRSVTKVIETGFLAILLMATPSCASSTKSAQTPPATATPASSTSTSVAPTSTPSPPTTTTQSILDVRVYFLHGDRIDVSHHTVAATREVATVAMTDLLAGPTAADRAAGLATTIPPGTRLLGINVVGDLATVDLTAAFASGGGSLSMAGRLAQVTYTLTQFPTIHGVLFHLDGKAVTVFGGEGLILDHPATRNDFESVTPAILVEFPGRGSAARTPLQISGSANVFEAQFQAELTDHGGRVIATQTIHASAGTGTRGVFTAAIAFPASARGAATLTVFDTSAKDGSRIDMVTIPVELVA